MRIVIVAMVESIHTARWVNQLAGLGWDIHLFPSLGQEIHPNLRDVTVHLLTPPSVKPHPSVRVRSQWPVRHGKELVIKVMRRLKLGVFDSAYRLARLVRRVKPDIVHSLEIQHSGYLTLEARNINGTLPPWIVTNWGSDVYLFGRLAEHRERIKEVLASCNFYSCECNRDVALARSLGLKAPVLPVFPNAGGFDLEEVEKWRTPGPTSQRRVILLKGYQNWAGRALVGLKALQLVGRDLLRGYRIVMYTTVPDVVLAAQLVSQDLDASIEGLPHISHAELMRWFGKARIYMGLSISDGVCTSMLEAMVMGAFPIQSNTACADEWLSHGQTGMIVPPEDPAAIADALRRALTDNALVDRADEHNRQVAARRLDSRLIRPMAKEFYQRVTARPGSGRSLPLCA